MDGKASIRRLQLDLGHTFHFSKFAHCVQQFGGNRFIHRQHHDRIAAHVTASYLHRGDVDAVFTEDGTDAPDDTGTVVVVNVEQIAFWSHVDGKLVDFHDARSVTVEPGAA